MMPSNKLGAGPTSFCHGLVRGCVLPDGMLAGSGVLVTKLYVSKEREKLPHRGQQDNGCVFSALPGVVISLR